MCGYNILLYILSTVQVCIELYKSYLASIFTRVSLIVAMDDEDDEQLLEEDDM